MTDPKPLNLRAEFPPVSVAEWEAQIHKDLKGADYNKKLVTKTDDGIAIRPYYTAADAPPGEFAFARPGHTWQMSPLPVDVDAARFHEAGATAVQELAFALTEAVDLFAAKHKPLTIRFAIGSNFFFEIAKLRAARLLWAQAAAVFGVKSEDLTSLRIQAVTALSNKTLYDPYNNLLRASTEALAAVLGGCDALTVIPFRFDPRLADNVQHILREESHLDRVADPAAGSYYVEVLTDALAREAWKLFQTAPSREQMDEALAKSREIKESAVASRRRTIVGTNNFPNWKEHVDCATEVEGWRLAGIFERVRLRTERHIARGGRQPKVLLLERGDVKMRKARAGFCTNFFGCAGFALATRQKLEPADLIVLCSADAEYLDFANDIVHQATVPVFIAGNPKEHVEALKAAGVAGFVHLGSNAVETLTDLQNKLGVAK